ncbi:MAG: PmoA family protein [Planctomycetes bacterium]|nr:PmoA family protein [Planctomycetota bacterium]
MPNALPRCQIEPLPDDQASFRVDGHERLRWHFGSHYPRPFLYPLNGPGGTSLTRMGHPGAPNHDHHQSVWFAHHKVLGIDFWANNLPPRIRQKEWLAYVDSDAEAIMAVKLGWYDGHDPKELLNQELMIVVRPGGPAGSETATETLVELQSTFHPTADMLEFGKTNFGFLAVRVAKSLSAHFGGGVITDSEGRVGEPAIFGNRARWMDYSGPVPGDRIEGITYHDHPTNPGFPTHWHVREDGWMGASACFAEPLVTTKAQPLVLRYLLHVHSSKLNVTRATEVSDQFAALPALTVSKATARHETWSVKRST